LYLKASEVDILPLRLVVRRHGEGWKAGKERMWHYVVELVMFKKFAVMKGR
jgi:hypothetical protein